MTLEWQRLTPDNKDIHRMRTPKGWLVSETDPNTGAVSLVYVPDPENEWHED